MNPNHKKEDFNKQFNFDLTELKSHNLNHYHDPDRSFNKLIKIKIKIMIKISYSYQSPA